MKAIQFVRHQEISLEDREAFLGQFDAIWTGFLHIIDYFADSRDEEYVCKREHKLHLGCVPVQRVRKA